MPEREVRPGPLGVRRAPRRPSIRLLLAVLLWLGIWLGGVVVGVIPGAAVPYLLGVFGTLAVKVSYRWRDCFLMLIPFYNLYWSFRISWRVAGLPYRDWSPRPEEQPAWVPVPGGPRVLYVAVDGTGR